MKLIGIMPVKNEAWCLGLSARVALKWCDIICTGNHGSTDNTSRIISDSQDEFPGRVVNWEFHDQEWTEMIHRQILLDRARALGATHIAIIDADEVLTGNLCQAATMSRMVEAMPHGSILQLPGYNLRDDDGPANGLWRYHNNGVWGNRWFSVAFADEPCLGWSGDKFHSREPICALRPSDRLKPYRPVAQGQGGVMHLWGASERRLIAKHALYKLTERIRWPQKSVREIDELYSLAIHGSIGDGNFGTPESWTYSPVPASWWAPYADLMKYLDVNAEPWQEAECVRLVKEHGPRMFKGLDLFGVV